jgi:hypothetical protein
LSPYPFFLINSDGLATHGGDKDIHVASHEDKDNRAANGGNLHGMAFLPSIHMDDADILVDQRQ